MSGDKEIIIVGAGDHGRGTLEILLAAAASGAAPRVRGFLDDAPAKADTTVGGVPVLGRLDWIQANHQPGFRYIIGIADCRAKQVIADRLKPFSLEYATAVHPSAVLARGVDVRPGAIINAGVAIAYDTVIGEHATINLNATIGHDCLIERYSTVAPGANVAGRVRLGEACDIGLNATVGRGLSIGPWAVVGPGTVVLKEVAPGHRIFGNPSRVVGRA